MLRNLLRAGSFSLLIVSTALVQPIFADDESADAPFGLDRRIPWTTSRVTGSPEPPLPFVAEEAFPNIPWERPLYIKPEPGTTNLIVVQQGGGKDSPSKLLRADDKSTANETAELLQVDNRLIYSIAFHPDYSKNGFVYLFTNGPWQQSDERRDRISRYTLTDDVVDPDSELIILDWQSRGHDGGDLAFGPDGMLYATTGDGTVDSDEWTSAQDVTTLHGAVLRIDVDHPNGDLPYSIPTDNPFLDVPNARGELWAIGLRNPWRMTIDPDTGEMWLGNNGQDLWETVHRVRPGENYGWSVYEGSHPFYPNRELGPGKLTAPTLEHHHTEARSVTGGVVYTGDLLPDLRGAYVYGDYDTGKIWAARHDGTKVTWHKEIADSTMRIAGFSNSHQGELLIADHYGTIYRLAVNPASLKEHDASAFPRKLSDTGIFQSVFDHRVAAGVIAYSVNTPAWNDGAIAERFLAIPDDGQMTWSPTAAFTCSNGTVLVQTLSLNGRRIETRLLTRQDNEWAGYSYEWKADQSAAILVERDGKNTEIRMADGSAQPWRIPSRAECMSCHNRGANYLLGITALQLNGEHIYGDIADNQLRTFDHIGLFDKPLADPASPFGAMVNPYDINESLDKRARSWLHTNCSVCHVIGGGGNARMQLYYFTQLDQMNVVSHFPQHSTLGLSRPRILAPGEPDQSVLLARISRRGRGQMPPLVSRRTDDRGIALIHEWIASMESDRRFVRDWSVADLRDRLPANADGPSLKHGEALFKSSGCAQCHRLGDGRGGIGPSLTGVSERLKPVEILESIISPSTKIEEKYANTIIVTVHGQALQGRIESESDESVVLRTNEAFAESVHIARSDIDERTLSKVSSMPKGTLNHLEPEEILDLLAYVISQSE